MTDTNIYETFQKYVNAVQKSGIDITSVRGEWIRIGFVCAQFGESGREAYHIISAFHPEYTYQETDEKFTELLRNSRDEVRPATLFGICHDYGIRPDGIACDADYKPALKPVRPVRESYTIEGIAPVWNGTPVSWWISEDINYYDPPIWNNEPTINYTIDQVAEIIASPLLKQQTVAVRSATGYERKRLKASILPHVTFSGCFSPSRKAEHICSLSNLICFDLDHIADPEGIKEIFSALPITRLAFISPSGDGVKWIVQVNLEEDTFTNYFNDITEFLLKSYGLKPDPSGKDISRACFLCFDNNAYINV